VTIAAVAGTKPQEAGLASGLINTSQQIGGAVGIAILSTIAVSTTDDALATGTAAPVALTDGFQAAFWAGAAITFAGVLVSLFMVRGRDLQEQEEPRGRDARGEQARPRSDTIAATSSEGGAMYGRLIEIEGVDASKREEVLGIIRERIIPGLKEIEGFAGFISLVDEENRRARSVVLWETRDGADEAERTFAAKREEIVRGMGGTVRSADLYEAPIVEVLAGVRA